MIAHTTAVALSHMEAIRSRATLVLRHAGPVHPKRHAKWGETCPLCGHQLGAPETRPPRDERGPGGQIRRRPAEILAWRRCGGCGLHQTGEPPRPPERGLR